MSPRDGCRRPHHVPHALHRPSDVLSEGAVDGEELIHTVKAAVSYDKGVDAALRCKECRGSHLSNEPHATATIPLGETRLLPCLVRVSHADHAVP